MEKEELNPELHKKIVDASELLLKKEKNKNISAFDAIKWLTEISSERYFNQISDIYIYEEGFAAREKELKHTILHAITSVISHEYGDENIAYVENIILTDDDKKSEAALEFLLKIGRYHLKFQNRVLQFVEQSLVFFSKNKLNLTALYLVKVYQQDKRVVDLFQKTKALHDERFPYQKEDDDEHSEASDELRILNIFADILNGEAVESVAFSVKVYQEEFLEGLKFYEDHEKKATDEQLKKILRVLSVLAHEMANFINTSAKSAMDKGFHLSDLKYGYKVRPEIRGRLQDLIDNLKQHSGEAVDIANFSSAKAQITNAIGNLLNKYEIGEDMLQLAQSFENIDSWEVAIKIYRSIMNDFESESSKSSSGLFPEISQIDVRPDREIEIFEQAKAAYQRLSERPRDKKAPVQTENTEETSQNTGGGFFTKLKGIFKKNS